MENLSTDLGINSAKDGAIFLTHEVGKGFFPGSLTISITGFSRLSKSSLGSGYCYSFLYLFDVLLLISMKMQ